MEDCIVFSPRLGTALTPAYNHKLQQIFATGEIGLGFKAVSPTAAEKGTKIKPYILTQVFAHHQPGALELEFRIISQTRDQLFEIVLRLCNCTVGKTVTSVLITGLQHGASSWSIQRACMRRDAIVLRKF
jgi:hypothetical protein